MRTQLPSRTAPVSGPVLFGRYAFGPNRLGYCGTDDHAALLGHAASHEDGALRDLARTFEGAYPYLELIAASAGIADPLDRRVVEAYWLGNELSLQVEPRLLHRSMQERFRGRMVGDGWRWLQASVPAGAHPVHAFHVLDVFPRAGLLRGERAPDVVRVIDSCRIRWGRVLDVDAGWLLVEAPALGLVGGKLRMGAARVERVERWVDGVGFVDDVQPGDMVSLHWGWACDRLTPRQLANLVRWTHHQLRIANLAI